MAETESNTKLENFLSRQLGDKSVIEIPGIESRHEERLLSKGIDKAYIVFGVFLALKKDKDDFAEWLRKAAATNTAETKTCYRAFKLYAKKFM